MNEIRNELLLLLNMEKETKEEDKKFKLEWLLERFQYDIEKQLQDIEYKKQELENNLKTLEFVKKELNIK